METKVQVPATHSDMVKFTNMHHETYVTVKRYLKRFEDEATKEVPKRFDLAERSSSSRPALLEAPTLAPARAAELELPLSLVSRPAAHLAQTVHYEQRQIYKSPDDEKKGR